MYPKINLNDCDQVLTGRYETCFHNDGTDFIDYGRPSWAVNNLRPSVDTFTIECEFILTNAGLTQYFLTFGADSGTDVQLGFLVQTGILSVRVGSSTDNVATLASDKYYKLKVEATPTNLKAYLNETLELDTSATGSYIGISNLFFGGRTDGGTFDPQGYFRNFTFYKGIGDTKELLEHFPLNGSPNGVNGTIGTITDGTPTGVWDYKFCRDVSTKKYYGVFDGSNYLTVPKAQTITSEYKLFFECDFIPTAPESFERLYEVPTTDVFRVFIRNDNNTIDIRGNGEVGQQTVATFQDDELSNIKLYLKNGYAKIVLNGVSEEFAIVTSELTWLNYGVAGSTAGKYTGKMLYFRDQDEKFTLDNTLTGTLGTTATLTGSNFFSVDPNLYALEEAATGNLNLNPTGSALVPYPNSFETKATLESYGDNLKTYVSKNTDSIFHNVTKKNSSFDPVAEFFTNKS